MNFLCASSEYVSKPRSFSSALLTPSRVKELKKKISCVSVTLLFVKAEKVQIQYPSLL
jgi:hypothetical protein